MKTISLWQPWATLVALGVKTIETRSWGTSYRGPLAIHAAKRVPESERLGDWWCEPTWGREFGLLDESGEPRRLPLSAVVATCRLVGVVPMLGFDAERNIMVGAQGQPIMPSTEPSDFVADTAHDGLGSLRRITLTHAAHAHSITDLEHQRPYGDFRAGRFAWLLEEIEQIEPTPWRGRQGFFDVPIESLVS